MLRQLQREAIIILQKVKDQIHTNSDCTWVYYETPDKMKEDIDKYISELEKGNLLLLDEMYVHFLPTAAYQEHAIANGWSIIYHKLAEQFDEVYKCLKDKRC
ncbi:MAG: hypothetical protein QM764_10305 [Chitinophagaceae bacterium]